MFQREIDSRLAVVERLNCIGNPEIIDTAAGVSRDKAFSLTVDGCLNVVSRCS